MLGEQKWSCFGAWHGRAGKIDCECEGRARKEGGAGEGQANPDSATEKKKHEGRAVIESSSLRVRGWGLKKPQERPGERWRGQREGQALSFGERDPETVRAPGVGLGVGL